LNHRKKTKADGSRLIPRKHTETLVLLSVFVRNLASTEKVRLERVTLVLRWFRCIVWMWSMGHAFV